MLWLVPLAGLASAAPAAAQDRPAIVPTRDVAITYRATAPATGRGQAAQQPQTLRMAITAGGKLMRVEGMGGAAGKAEGQFAIIDRTAQRMILVMPQDRRYMEMPAMSAFSRGFILSDTMKFVRRGSETVAGLKCTVWDITSEDGAGTACVTDDGVLLRGKGEGGKGAIEATAVSYAPQPASLFKPPADFQRMEMPTMPQGGVPPGNRPPRP